MIPGKVFFQSINISQHFNKNYQIHLLVNGIFYDKIKPFQSKYLCLTANDLLEIQLAIKNQQKNKENYEIFSQQKFFKNQNHISQNIPQQSKQIPTQFLKILIPQAYKLVLESKTIDIKFKLNSKNQNQEIKINLSFEPVSAFSHKKLGKTITSNKMGLKNSVNLNATQQRVSFFQKASRKNETFGQSLSVNSPQSYFPEKIDYPRRRNSKQKSPSLGNQRKYTEKEEINLSKTMQNRRGYFRQRMEDETNFIKDEGQENKSERKFNYIPNDIIIEDQSLNSANHHEQSLKPLSSQIKRPQRKYKLDATKRIIEPNPHFNQQINIQMFSDIMQNNTYTSRGNLIQQGTQQKIIEKNSEEFPRNPQNPKKYQTQTILKSFESSPQNDTLESLAYQREKILGELFGKLGTKSKK